MGWLKKIGRHLWKNFFAFFAQIQTNQDFHLLKVGYPGSLHHSQKSPTSPTGSAGGHIDPEVFCPTSAAAAAAAAFNFPPYGGAVNGPNGLNGQGGHPALGECTPKTEIEKDH